MLDMWSRQLKYEMRFTEVRFEIVYLLLFLQLSLEIAAKFALVSDSSGSCHPCRTVWTSQQGAAMPGNADRFRKFHPVLCIHWGGPAKVVQTQRGASSHLQARGSGPAGQTETPWGRGRPLHATQAGGHTGWSRSLGTTATAVRGGCSSSALPPR